MIFVLKEMDDVETKHQTQLHDIDFPSTSSANGGGARNRSTPTNASLSQHAPNPMQQQHRCRSSSSLCSHFCWRLRAWHMLATQQLLGGATAVRLPPPQNNDESRSEVTIPIHFEAPFPSPSSLRRCRVLTRLDRVSHYVKPPPLSSASADLEKEAQLRWAV